MSLLALDFVTASSTSEVAASRKQDDKTVPNSIKIKNETPIAIIKRSSGSDSVPKGSLATVLPWGHGWGWVTLPNGIWNGALTWSQCEDAITLNALPATDCTNIVESGGDVYHHIGHHPGNTNLDPYEYSTHAVEGDLAAAEDYDYAVDCGDFIF